jgi:peptide/nickel transport system substrate-binding protein
MKGKTPTLFGKLNWPLILALFFALALVACGSAAAPAPASEPAAPVPVVTESTPVPQPEVAAAPAEPTVAKDSITIVMAAEPGSVDPWNPTCNATLDTAVCNEIVNEPMTWITSDTFEVVTLSGVESWQQVDSRNWDFTLRQGVKFHNGEPWNAVTAKAGIDQNGDVNNSSQSYGNHGPIHGEVISDYVVRVVCGADCPNLPRGMIFNRFQAPEWYATVSKDESSRQLYGIGPYRFLEWRPGIDITMEIYDDYVPNPDTSIVDGQAPHIKHLTNTWRSEQLVRSAMVETGEADWAADIGFENQDVVPKSAQSGTTEVYALIPDTMWHPELKKQFGTGHNRMIYPHSDYGNRTIYSGGMP